MPKAAIGTFPAYKFIIRPVETYPTYFNAETKAFTPLSKVKPAMGFHEVYEVLDSITLAVEAGTVPRDGWVKHLFGTKKVFESFMDQLTDYDECYRITDRWWHALAALAGTVDEEGFITCAEIVDTLCEAAQDSGQL